MVYKAFWLFRLMVKGGFICSILFVFLIQFVYAGSIGISPAYFKEFFEPNFEKTYSFSIYSPSSTGNISLK